MSQKKKEHGKPVDSRNRRETKANTTEDCIWKREEIAKNKIKRRKNEIKDSDKKKNNKCLLKGYRMNLNKGIWTKMKKRNAMRKHQKSTERRQNEVNESEKKVQEIKGKETGWCEGRIAIRMVKKETDLIYIEAEIHTIGSQTYTFKK